MIRWWITKGQNHLKTNSTTYLKHLIFAFKAGLLSIVAGLILILHGLFPFWLEYTGSNLIKFLSKLFENRHRIDDT